jgi:hypothetical protein
MQCCSLSPGGCAFPRIPAMSCVPKTLACLAPCQRGTACDADKLFIGFVGCRRRGRRRCCAAVDATARVSYGVAAGMRPVAPKRRRSCDYVCTCCGNAPCGVRFTPQRDLRADLLRKQALWRQNGAGAGASYALAAKTRPVAPKRRHSSDFRNPVGTPSREQRRESRTLNPHYDAC